MENNQGIKSYYKESNVDQALQARPIHYDFTYKKPFLSHKTIDQLLVEGYVGIDHKLIKDNAFAGVAYKFKNQIRWTLSSQVESEIWLMTTDKNALEELSKFMLNKFSWSPMIYAARPQAAFIFEPKNDTERAAIEATISGEYGWQGSLYSLEIYEYHDNEAGFIFTTKPLDSVNQEWLLVKLNFQDYTGSWSHHEGLLEDVYYIWKENIQLTEPNYNPTSDEILDAISE